MSPLPMGCKACMAHHGSKLIQVHWLEPTAFLAQDRDKEAAAPTSHFVQNGGCIRSIMFQSAVPHRSCLWGALFS